MKLREFELDEIGKMTFNELRRNLSMNRDEFIEEFGLTLAKLKTRGGLLLENEKYQVTLNNIKRKLILPHTTEEEIKLKTLSLRYCNKIVALRLENIQLKSKLLGLPLTVERDELDQEIKQIEIATNELAKELNKAGLMSDERFLANMELKEIYTENGETK